MFHKVALIYQRLGSAKVMLLLMKKLHLLALGLAGLRTPREHELSHLASSTPAGRSICPVQTQHTPRVHTQGVRQNVNIIRLVQTNTPRPEHFLSNMGTRDRSRHENSHFFLCLSSSPRGGTTPWQHFGSSVVTRLGHCWHLVAEVREAREPAVWGQSPRGKKSSSASDGPTRHSGKQQIVYKFLILELKSVFHSILPSFNGTQYCRSAVTTQIEQRRPGKVQLRHTGFLIPLI